MKWVITIFLAIFCCTFSAWADDTFPAVGSKAVPENTKKTNTAIEDEETVTVKEPKLLLDTAIMGSYHQPGWTTHRRFPTTRVYVVPKGTVTFEYWLQQDGLLKSDSAPKYGSTYELEFGLGYRLQLDLYLCTSQSEGYAPFDLASEKIELRWAIADWGKIFGNPALYLEWIRQHEAPQKLEGKVLLGDTITPRLFWGLNLVYERELGEKSEQEYAISFGMAYVIIDGIFSIGVEGKLAAADEQGSRFDFSETKFLLGPSLQFKPIYGIHLDLVPMFGATFNDEAQAIYTVYFVLGKEFSM